jgi:hypothetical protein
MRPGNWSASSQKVISFDAVSPGQAATDFVHEHGCKVAEITTPEPLTITEDTALEEIVQLMEKNHVKRLPMIRRDKIVGIVSRANLLQTVASLARHVPDAAADDDDIAARAPAMTRSSLCVVENRQATATQPSRYAPICIGHIAMLYFTKTARNCSAQMATFLQPSRSRPDSPV